MNWCVTGSLIMFVLFVVIDCVIVLFNVDLFVLFCFVVFFVVCGFFFVGFQRSTIALLMCCSSLVKIT